MKYLKIFELYVRTFGNEEVYWKVPVIYPYSRIALEKIGLNKKQVKYWLEIFEYIKNDTNENVDDYVYLFRDEYGNYSWLYIQTILYPKLEGEFNIEVIQREEPEKVKQYIIEKEAKKYNM